ncbi:MAG: Rpn family recombination-promoting nuclease/putative transposase [Campylobacterota bacterium]|nr:Rpn family recombination-promoting nuclease/putative transposase [Campylobacterota bacterium]
MLQKRKLISFDWAIKRVLRSKANFEILEGFLSELLFEDITILEILESESNQELQDDKFNVLDVKVKNQKDEVILIEIQYSSELDYLQRILYASSKVITEHMKKGDAFSEVAKVISISILYFDFGDGDDYIYKGTTNFIGVHNHTQLKLNEKQKELYKTEKVEKIYPEYYLIKVRNFNNSSKDTLDEWINFLKNEEIPDNPKAKGLLKAKEELDYMKMNKEEQLQYSRHEMQRHHEASIYESTYVIGKLEGHKEGEKNKAYKIAINLLDILDDETIALKTDLSIQEVTKLRSESMRC